MLTVLEKEHLAPDGSAPKMILADVRRAETFCGVNRRYAKDHPQEAFDRLLHKRFRRAALLGKFHIVVTVAELVPCSNSSLGLLQAGAAGLKVTNAFTCQPVVG